MIDISAEVLHGAATHIARRELNEDFLLSRPPLFAVADGMGGHQAGEVASRTAVEVVARELERNAALIEAVKAANEAVHEQALANPELQGMGTTIVAMVAGPDSAQIVNVGDSRAYLFRQGTLRRLTQDHSVVERMARQGQIRKEDADFHPQRSLLERALGVESDVDVDAHTVAVEPGDRILLCTDGLNSILDDDHIRAILAEEKDPEKASKRLVAEAVSAGGSDNVTAMVIDYPGGQRAVAAPRKTPVRRLALVAIFLVALLAIFAVRGALANSWYVGIDRDRVAIFNGVPSSVAGFRLSRVAERTDLQAASLPDPVREDLQNGIKAEDRSDAREIVANLRQFPQLTSPAAQGESESSYTPVSNP